MVAVKRGTKCSCGCDQKSAATVRQRKLTCAGCGCLLRMTRGWLEDVGAPACACGGQFVPDCLEDRIRLPGAAGEEAWTEYMGRETVRAVRAEHGRLGGEATARRTRARAAVRVAAAAAGRGDMPF